MAQPQIAVNNLNLAQGETDEIERAALFIGEGATNTDSLIPLDAQSDLDDALGTISSAIKDQVEAAQSNGGSNWKAWAVPITNGDDWKDTLDSAMLGCSPELVVLCDPATASADLEAMQTKAESIRTSLGRRIVILTASETINDSTQTWAEYLAAQTAITNGVAAYRVVVVPLLHGNDLGVLVGRLCKRSISIADSPMRFATGPVVGLGETPVDSAAIELPSATLAALDGQRLSCIYKYVDVAGTYWGDANCLDIDGGDYQVIENLRVVDKACRKVRLKAISKVADRSLNSTSGSIAQHKTYFMKPLREMAEATEFNSITIPGDIKSPTDESIVFTWKNSNEVNIFVAVQPYNSPKTIIANVILDSSQS
ncbi:MAG: DUF2586 family protein [Flavobacteriales bacterium]|nr:DUF2586 family protein [Flavobacteriales bacterium]